jgi:hypothetical protein
MLTISVPDFAARGSEPHTNAYAIDTHGSSSSTFDVGMVHARRFPVWGEHLHMPMREELFIPEGHPLNLARSSTWRRVWHDPDLSVIVAFSLIGLLVTLYMAKHCPFSQEIGAALMTIS